MDAAPTRDPATVAQFCAASDADLTPELLGRYAAWAMTTVGGADDFRHFLPRLLRLAAAGSPEHSLSPDAIAGKLLLAGWTQWPPGDRAAIAEVFGAGLDFFVLHHPAERGATPWLLGASHLDLDVHEMLERWIGSGAPNAALQLAVLIDELREGRIGNPASLGQALARRLAKPDVEAALIDATAGVEAEDQWLLDRAVDSVVSLKAGE